METAHDPEDPELPDDPELVRLPDGRRVQLWQGGAASGPAVLFFHGCPDTRRAAFSGDAAARRAGVRLVALNRPGYGRSDPAESGHLSVAADAVAVADRLGIGRFAVLGMSVGGPYALACAARYPQRVSAAGLVASPAEIPELDLPAPRDDPTDEQRAFYARLAAGPVDAAVALVRPEFEAYVRTLNPADPDDAALVKRFMAGLPPLDAALVSDQPVAEVAAGVREALVRTDGYLRDAAVTLRRWEFRPAQVRAPVRLWYGELDPNAPVRHGEWLARHLPSASLVVRAGTAHLGALLEHWDDILTSLQGVHP